MQNSQASMDPWEGNFAIAVSVYHKIVTLIKC